MPLRRAAIKHGLLGLAALGGSVLRPAPVDAATGTERRRVRVMSATDRSSVQPLIDDFERRNPGMQIEYSQLGSVDLYARFLIDVNAPGAAPDVVWSSAMDLQIKLVNDGHAMRYESPHSAQLPRWAIWKYEAFGTTQEPVGIVFNRRLLAETEVPRTHTLLTSAMRADPVRFRGRVATYDIEHAGLGFLIAAQDSMATPRFWEQVQALGLCQATLHADTQSMLEAVAAGRSLLAINVLGPYAESFARSNSDVGVVYPNDYTLVVSRVAFIARKATNPEGARAWLDYLLSREGQQLLVDAAGLYAVRIDAGKLRPGSALGRELAAAARPIALGPGLLAHLDRSTHDAFIKRWRREFELLR